MPDIIAATVTQGTVTLHLGQQHANPPDGWIADTTTWTLPTTTILPRADGQGREDECGG